MYRNVPPPDPNPNPNPATLTLGEQFAQWHTPEDGSFVQEPNADSDPATLTVTKGASTKAWEAFVSKRQRSFPEHAESPLFEVEKRMLCVKADGLDIQCCVRKILHQSQRALDSKYSDSAEFSTAIATMRNF